APDGGGERRRADLPPRQALRPHRGGHRGRDTRRRRAPAAVGHGEVPARALARAAAAHRARPLARARTGAAGGRRPDDGRGRARARPHPARGRRAAARARVLRPHRRSRPARAAHDRRPHRGAARGAHRRLRERRRGARQSAAPVRAHPRRAAVMTALLVGGYGPDMGGTASGVRTAESSPDGLVVGAGLPCDSPSWIAVRGERMVATLEGSGALAWFSRTPEGWRADGVTRLEAGSPCHAAFLDDDTVAVASYGDGAIVLARHGQAGPLQRLDGSGSGPLPAQEGPHAHHVHVLADGRVLTLDLGADRLHVHERRADGLLIRVDSLALPAGTGPRDLHALP